MIFWDTELSNSLSGLELKTFLVKKRIIKFLYRHGELSIVDFSKLLHVSIPTTAGYINELIDEGFIENRGKGDSIGGRKPNIYGLKKNSVFIVAINIGHKFFEIGIFDANSEKVCGLDLPAIPFTDRQKLIELVYMYVTELLDKEQIGLGKVMGIGVNMPGLIDSQKGINYTYLYDPEETLVDAFTKKFKRPVFLENDSKTRALAEMRYGAAKDYTNALVLQIDWGLGLGMILNGKLYKGNSGFAGEFSHIPIEANGVLCSCGKVGCLETIASGNALVRFAIEGLEDNSYSRLYEVYKKDAAKLTPKLIIEMAHSGDQFALSVIQKVGAGLGKGISYLIQILNPEVVILGGLLSQAGAYLELPIKQAMHQYCLPKLHEDTKILITPLGSDIGLIGSTIVVLENILENN